MRSFECFLNRNVFFGAGCLNEKLLPLLQSKGVQSVALITGGQSGQLEAVNRLVGALKQANIGVKRQVMIGEPTCEGVDSIVAEVREWQPDWVVAIGGGSVMDCGKAVSMMLKESGSVLDYLEGVGTQKPSGKKTPFVAVPTTAGTGSEATKNGVISGVVEGKPFKKSFRHDFFVPDVAVIDPILALGCPKGVSAASGMDALTQLIESFISVGANPLTDSLAVSGLTAVADSLESVVVDGSDLEARSGMAYAAWCSGVCLGHADLGVVHGIAGVLGAMGSIAHGVACGILLPTVMEALIRKLIVEGQPGSEKFGYLVKTARVGYLLNGEMESGFDVAEGCRKLMDILNRWRDLFGLGKLTDYGFDRELISPIAKGSSCRKSPVSFSATEIEEMLHGVC